MTINSIKLSQEPRIGGETFAFMHMDLFVQVLHMSWKDPKVRRVMPSKPLKHNFNYLVVQMGGPGKTTTQHVCDIPKAMWQTTDFDSYVKELFQHLLGERKAFMHQQGYLK